MGCLICNILEQNFAIFILTVTAMSVAHYFFFINFTQGIFFTNFSASQNHLSNGTEKSITYSLTRQKYSLNIDSDFYI